MITRNVLNTEKNSPDKIQGNHFFLFVASNTQATLYDQDMSAPIVWGSKDKVVAMTTDKMPELSVSTSINLQVYKWMGGKFSFKAGAWIKNTREDIKSFLHRFAA